MLQRIQSVYLLLTALLPGLFLSNGFLNFINKTGSEILFRFNGIFMSHPEQGLILIRPITSFPITFILIMGISVITIFLFKKRKLQMKIILGIITLTLIMIGLVVYYSVSVINEFQAFPVTGIKMVIPLLMLVLEVLAYSAIRKDENLVSSYDRLR